MKRIIKEVEIPVVNLETMREHLNPFPIDPNIEKYLLNLGICTFTSFVKEVGHPGYIESMWRR